jgi:DNA-binding transcriptional MerR regulator
MTIFSASASVSAPSKEQVLPQRAFEAPTTIAGQALQSQQLLTVKQAAAYLQIKPQTLFFQVKNGLIRVAGKDAKGHNLFHKPDLEQARTRFKKVAPTQAEEGLLSSAQVAELLKVSVSRVQELAATGQLKPLEQAKGKRRYFRLEAVEVYRSRESTTIIRS